MQAQVKEQYLKLIKKTIKGLREEFKEEGSDDAIEHLATLESRWNERLLATNEFIDDPLFMRAVATPRAARAPGMRSTIVSVGPGSGRNRATKRTIWDVSRKSVASPRKRPRNEKEDEGPPLEDSELKSSLSSGEDVEEEVQQESAQDDDEEYNSYVLAECNAVRMTSGTGKFKVILKEGMAHLNGRDYLFGKAACDLDW